MKVLFTDNVPGVASRGDVKNVRNGYFRNYLQPFKKAAAATSGLMKEWEERRKKIVIEKEQLRAKMEEIKRRIAGTKVTLEKKMTKKGTLYGGVKAADIVAAIKNALNLEVPENAVQIGESIKAVGKFEVTLNFGEGVQTTLPVEVVEKK